MSIQTTLGEPSVPEPVDRPARDVIFTANGSHRASRLIWRTGALVGFESMNTPPPPEIPIEFVDWPFSKVREMDDPDLGELFDQHLKVVADAQPKYAVAPDVNQFTGLRDVVAWADELRQYAETVIIVPKAVLPTDVPSGFRVGMPCQKRFGPPPWRWTQYRDCEEVHLLGGSPVDHHEILKYSVPVESVDTSVPVTSAGFGDFWNGKKWENSETEGDHFYPCLSRSYSNIRFSLNRRREVPSVRCRNAQHDYEQQFGDSPEADLWHDGDEPLSRAYEAYYAN